MRCPSANFRATSGRSSVSLMALRVRRRHLRSTLSGWRPTTWLFLCSTATNPGVLRRKSVQNCSVLVPARSLHSPPRTPTSACKRVGGPRSSQPSGTPRSTDQTASSQAQRCSTSSSPLTTPADCPIHGEPSMLSLMDYARANLSPSARAQELVSHCSCGRFLTASSKLARQCRRVCY